MCDTSVFLAMFESADIFLHRLICEGIVKFVLFTGCQVSFIFFIMCKILSHFLLFLLRKSSADTQDTKHITL